MTLSAFAAKRRAAVDRYLLPARRSAANPPHAAAAVDRRGRPTDGRTPDRYIDPAPHTMRAASIYTYTVAAHCYEYNSWS